MNEARYKDEYEFGLELLETLIRDALMFSLGASKDGVINEDVLPELQKIAAGLTPRARLDGSSELKTSANNSW